MWGGVIWNELPSFYMTNLVVAVILYHYDCKAKQKSHVAVASNKRKYVYLYYTGICIRLVTVGLSPRILLFTVAQLEPI